MKKINFIKLFKIEDLYYVNSLIFVSVYVIILNHLLINFDFFEFVNNSPDKLKFIEKTNFLIQYDLIKLLLSGKYTLPIQISIIFQVKYYFIAQILLLFISIISIGYLLNYYFNVTKYLAYIVLFIPSFSYILLLNLKDFYLFIAIANAAFILHYSKSINYRVLDNFNISKIIFILFLIFCNVYFFYFTRIYIFYLLFIFTLILFLFNYFYKRKQDYWKLILCLLFYVIMLIVLNLIFKTEVEGTPLIFFDGKLFPIYSDFEWQYTKYIPKFVDEIIRSISELRYANIQHNIRVEATTLFTENIVPKNSLEFLNNLPYLIFKSLFPFKLNFLTTSSIPLYIVSITEQIGIIFFLLIFLLYKNKTSYSYYFLFIFIIFLFLYSYTNPNIGSLLRYKSVIQIPFFLISTVYILKIFKNLFFNDQNEKDFTDKIVILFTLFLGVFLFLIRDIIIINSNIDILKLNYAIYFLIVLSLFSNLFISPSISSLNSIKNDKIYQFINLSFLLISSIILLIFFISSLLIITIIFSEKKILNEIVYSLLIFFSIPLNVVLSSMLMKKNKNLYIFSLNLLVPIITILFFIFFENSVNYLFKILFISTYTYSILMFMQISFNFDITNLKKIFYLKKRIINKFFQRLNSKIILQLNLFIFLFLIFVYNILSIKNAVVTYFLMKFVLLFVSIFNIFLAYNITKETKNLFTIKNYFFINTFVSILLIFIIILFKPFLFLVLGNKIIDIQTLNLTVYTFFLMPCLIFNVLIIKNIMNFNIKYSLIFKSFAILLALSSAVIFFFDEYLIKIIILFFSIVFLNYFLIFKISKFSFTSYLLITLSFFYINFSNIKVLIEKQNMQLIIANIFIIILIYFLNLNAVSRFYSNR